MNKQVRKEIEQRKFQRRCELLGLDLNKHYQYKAQGKPCSCFMCKKERYSRKNIKELEK